MRTGGGSRLAGGGRVAGRRRCRGTHCLRSGLSVLSGGYFFFLFLTFYVGSIYFQVGSTLRPVFSGQILESGSETDLTSVSPQTDLQSVTGIKNARTEPQASGDE